MAKGKYKNKRKKYNIDRAIENLCDQFEDADSLKKDFAEAQKIIENRYFDFPKHFKETVAFTLYAKMIASTVIGKHYALRVLEGKEAKEIDKILGYTTSFSEQKPKEQEKVVKVSLNGETVFLHESATMLEFLKAVKERTEQAVSVTKMIETEIEL